MYTLLCYNISTDKELVNNMNDKELLKTIQNDIKNIDEYIETCIDEDIIHYLYLIKQDMLIFKLEVLKHIIINKLFKEKQHE